MIYDTEAGAQETLELLEYANSQLLQFRYYDQLLDTELQRIYAQLQAHGWGRPWLSLFIDVNELTDFDRWKENVREKLQTLDDIYRFAVEQTAMTRGEFLEITIVLILVLDLVLFFAGIMR